MNQRETAPVHPYKHSLQNWHRRIRRMQRRDPSASWWSYCSRGGDKCISSALLLLLLLLPPLPFQGFPLNLLTHTKISPIRFV